MKNNALFFEGGPPYHIEAWRHGEADMAEPKRFKQATLPRSTALVVVGSGGGQSTAVAPAASNQLGRVVGPANKHRGGRTVTGV